ncbi:MAG: MBL fold metallo-hydrolase [Sedimentisphaerales bacterium]|nr:MBL fold metallo-hydrolase [Sedimentisphaerales bacterium]
MVRINQRNCLITSILVFAALCTSTFGKTIYVDDDATGANDGSSWENAYTFFQDALVDANDSEKPVEIRVAQGIYRPDQGLIQIPGNREATFQLINGVTITGGYAGIKANDPNARDIEIYETILSGDVGFSGVLDSCYHVITGSATDSTSILDSFTIKSGNDQRISHEPEDYDFGKGAGVYNKSGSPTLINCTFTRNRARYGGGIYNEDNSNPTLTNCNFNMNVTESGKGGGLYNKSGNPTLINCTFTRNQAFYGGGICNEDNSNPTLTNCIFTENVSDHSDGGGMYNENNSNPTLTNCSFNMNVALSGSGGGMANWESNPTLTNCTFSGNSATISGGGMDNYQGNPTLTNCTFTYNRAEMSGGMSNSESNPTLNNCTFSVNSAENYGGGMTNHFSNPILSSCKFSRNSAGVDGGGMYNKNNSGPTLTNCIFIANSSLNGGGIYNSGSNLILTKSIFSGNTARTFYVTPSRSNAGGLFGGKGGAMYNVVSNPILKNCTFVLNTAASGNSLACESSSENLPSNLEISNCIFGSGANEIWNNDGSLINIVYCNIQSDQDSVYDPCEAIIWGDGNNDADPLFADTGRWADVNDPNIIVEPNDPNAVWIDGDYHLKSEAGRWDPVSESWVVDDVTSPCIDVGDPNSPVGDEPEPNGGRINMGAYGGTAEASKSLAGAEQIVYVQWLGHSTVKVWTDDCIVYVDPERVPEALNDATLVCVTHTHGDHYSPSDIAKVSNAQTQFIAPPDVVQSYGSGQTIAPGQTIEFVFVAIKAVPAYNINKSNHPKSNNWVGYIIELGGKRIYVAGDTDLIEEMKTLGDIDVAFLPAGGTYTMNATEAAEATGYIKPDLAIPYHWGQSVGTIADAQRFAELAQCPAMVLTVGESISSDHWPEYSPLIAHWALDEIEGDIAHDSAGENHGTLNNNPVWQPVGGKIDGGLLLDGIDDYVGADFVLDPANGPFSVFAWIKGGTAGQEVISQADGTGSGETWLGADPLLGRLMTGLVPPSAGRFVPQPLISESIITDAQWHHIGFVWDGSYRALYVDSAEVVKDTAVQSPLKSADGGIYIGADKNLDAAAFFSGLIDNVHIYNTALSTEEIGALAE